MNLRTLSGRIGMTGILFVLKTAIQWKELPREMGCGSGVSCWRRLRDWQAQGDWDRLFHLLLEQLQATDRIDWSRAALDSSQVPAKRETRRLARSQPTAVVPAASTTFSRTRRASRSVPRR